MRMKLFPNFTCYHLISHTNTISVTKTYCVTQQTLKVFPPIYTTRPFTPHGNDDSTNQDDKIRLGMSHLRNLMEMWRGKIFQRKLQSRLPVDEKLVGLVVRFNINQHRDGDGVTTVEREWYIFHRMPGHIFIFLDLFSEDLLKRIQYTFKESENWKNKLLWRTNWKETRITLYDEQVIKRKELEAQGLYSKTHVKTH